MSVVVFPSPRKHNEFSFEDQVVRYWQHGFCLAELRILTGMFEEYSEDGMPEEDQENLFDEMLNFYKNLDHEETNI